MATNRIICRRWTLKRTDNVAEEEDASAMIVVALDVDALATVAALAAAGLVDLTVIVIAAAQAVDLAAHRIVTVIVVHAAMIAMGDRARVADALRIGPSVSVNGRKSQRMSTSPSFLMTNHSTLLRSM